MDCTVCTGCSWHLARAPNTRSFPVIDELRFNNVTGPGEQQSGLEEMQIHSDPPLVNFNGGNTMQVRPLLVARLA